MLELQKIPLLMFILLIFGLFVSCEEKKIHGKTGTTVTLEADISEDINDLDFIWTLVNQPDASMLVTGDFDFSENQSVVSFVPDNPGEYEFEVRVLQFGDELSLQTFLLAIEGKPFVVANKSGADEKKWYEEEDKEWLEEETTPVLAEKTEESKIKKEEVATPTVTPPAVTTQPKKTTPKKKVEPKAKPKPLKGSSIPIEAGRFTIQVLSKKQLSSAKTAAADLINDGFDAYIQKAYFKETDEVWFRVRVGSYESREAAKEVSKSISITLGIDTWVDHVRLEE